MRIEDYLEKEFGYDKNVKNKWSRYITLWKSWYEGKVKSFHNYTIYNGQNRVACTRKSMQMAKKICEDWADLLFNERCKITVSNEQSQKQLDELLDKLDFYDFVNESVEKSGASGTGAAVISIRDLYMDEDTGIMDMTESEPIVEYVDVDWMFPISWNGKKITECAFGARRTVKGKEYIILSIHVLDAKNEYIIKNRAFLYKNGNITEVEQDESFDDFHTGSRTPWFAIFSPAGNNNIAPELPWGLPYFANAIDDLKACDIGFDGFVNEISLGRKRIFVKQEMMQYDKNGIEQPTFDPNDISVYVLPQGFNKDDMIQTDATGIRSGDFVSYLRTSLSMLSAKVGMGKDHYDFDPVNLTTATQVVSQNGQLFRRKKKHENRLESALYDLISGLAYAATKFSHYSIDTAGLMIAFDDSIIEDKEAIANRTMREVSAGLRSKPEYRQIVMGETESVANKKIKEIQEEEAANRPLFGGGEE